MPLSLMYILSRIVRRKLEYKVLNSFTDSTLTMKQVENLFPDPDNDLADASKKQVILFSLKVLNRKEKKRPLLKNAPR